MKYPFLDLRAVNEPFFAELKEAACRVVESGRYIGGAEVEDFEESLAAASGVPFAVGVSNGLDALRMIFRAYIALGHLRQGDAVIVPANTYIASVLSITDAGLEPVFVDADANTLNMDTRLLDEAYTPRVKAVLTVHLYGRPCYDERLREFVERRGLILVEDNAQAIGATAGDGRPTGSLGDAAALSFYPTKNIGALGDAGAVLTADDELARTVRAIANYGSDRRYHNIYEGFNCRIDPLQAAFLNVKLKRLGKECERRRQLAAAYDALISHPCVRKPRVDRPDNSVWHQYAVLVPERDAFRAYLAENGVGTDVNYPVPPHKQPCYARFSGLVLPVAEEISDMVVCLPVSACTSVDDAKAISEIVNKWEYEY